jgi:hypothetical protein
MHRLTVAAAPAASKGIGAQLKINGPNHELGIIL